MKTALIIPAYKPGPEMLELLNRFTGNADFQPIVVDDGSGAEYQHIFDALPEGVIFLRHPQNRGKGAALKTAMRHVLEHCPECALALTADADGQHKYEDILRITESAKVHKDALVLGSRKFEGEVPFKSRWGNAITRRVFSIASGARVYDTQTGLRAFGREAMAQFVEVPGDRYEYEINMLLQAAQSGRPILEEWIETVYLNENASSHFNPFKDSLKIYLCILKFCASSLLAFIIDYVLVLLFNAVLIALPQTRGLPAKSKLLITVVCARVISATVNFFVNNKVVFKGNESLGKAAVKYASLALCILAVNYALMHLLNIVWAWPLALAKIVVEVLLFCVNFVVQGKFVFRKQSTKEI